MLPRNAKPGPGDIAAPGIAILTTALPSSSLCPSGAYTTTCSGTSFAAPLVSAAAALLRSRYPSWSNADIRTRLLSTAVDLGAPGFDNTYGNGLLNIGGAIGVTAAINGLSIAYQGQEQTWTSTVSGGQTPYSYQWYIAGSSAGTGTSASYTPGLSDFWVVLHVTDYLSQVGSDSIFVTISSCTPPQISC
ncbi:MAG: S8 family serine peptidase [Gammaproteobacteria bacterium]